VYVAEALLGEVAEQMLETTERAGSKMYVSTYVLDETARVIVEKLGFSRRFAVLTRRRVERRSISVEPGASRHTVPGDPADNPVLNGALDAGADYLVTNDPHLLRLDPYESLRIISMTDYYRLLVDRGLISEK
jgi:predicted nucleic acid-binding protein